MMAEMLRRVLAPLQARIAAIVTRAVVSAIDDTRLLQALQVRARTGEVLDGLERFQQYGLTSMPRRDAEALILSLGGRRDHSVVIAVDDRRYRLRALKEGEVALYTDQGQKVHLRRDRTIQIRSAPDDNPDAREVTVDPVRIRIRTADVGGREVLVDDQRIRLRSLAEGGAQEVQIDDTQVRILSGATSSIVLNPAACVIRAPVIQFQQG